MAPTVHSSTPARVEAAASATSVTTASFTAPAGSLLVAAVVIDAGAAPAPTLTMSNSGTALTWTTVAEQVTGGAVGSAMFVASAPTSVARTVTFTTSNSDNKSLKVYVVQGHDTANPTGDVTSGTVSINTVAIPGLVSTRSGSLGFYAAAQDESAAATPTSAETAFDPVFISAQVAGGSGHKPMGAVATETTYTIDADGTVLCAWHYVGVEVLTATQSVSPTAIASVEAFGAATVNRGAVSVAPAGIPTAEGFGTATLRLTVTPTGIASGEAFGAATVNVTGVISPAGIPSGEAFGTPGISPQHVSPAGIGSGEAFGTASLTLTVAVPGIATAETFGTPTVSLIVYPAAIPTGETFGAATVSPGPVAISPLGIDTGEQFGAVDVFITLDPTERIRPVRLRVVPLYEVVVVGRVPAQAGPPTFLQVDPLDWSKITWSSTLSRPQKLSVTVKTSTITEPIAQRLRNPDRLPTELWVSRNGRRVFAGPLLGGARNGDELTLECGGLLTYLQWMIVNADLRFDQVDQFAITTALIDQWQNLEFGHFGIDTTAVGASGVLRDRSYVRNEIHQVARRVEELGAVRDGFDAEIDPTTRELRLWYPGKGVDRSVGDDAIVFDGRNIDDQNAMFSVGPADLASHAFGSGSRSGGDSTLWSEQFNSDLRAAFGRAAITAAFSDVELQGTLDDHVGGLLDARDQPLRAPGQRVRVPVDADLDAYDVGDTVTYELDDLLGIGGAWRIRSRTVNVEKTGSEAVDLEFV